MLKKLLFLVGMTGVIANNTQLLGSEDFFKLFFSRSRYRERETDNAIIDRIETLWNKWASKINSTESLEGAIKLGIDLYEDHSKIEELFEEMYVRSLRMKQRIDGGNMRQADEKICLLAVLQRSAFSLEKLKNQDDKEILVEYAKVQGGVVCFYETLADSVRILNNSHTCQLQQLLKKRLECIVESLQDVYRTHIAIEKIAVYQNEIEQLEDRMQELAVGFQDEEAVKEIGKLQIHVMKLKMKIDHERCYV